MEERISLTSDRPPRPNSELVPSDPIWFLKSDHLSGSVCDLSARLCEHVHVPVVLKQWLRRPLQNGLAFVKSSAVDGREY